MRVIFMHDHPLKVLEYNSIQIYTDAKTSATNHRSALDAVGVE